MKKIIFLSIIVLTFSGCLLDFTLKDDEKTTTIKVEEKQNEPTGANPKPIGKHEEPSETDG